MSKRPRFEEAPRESAPPKPPANRYRHAFTCVGMARGPTGWRAVTVKLDENGNVLSVNDGVQQSYPEYVAAEAKKLLHRACLVRE